MVLLVRTDLPMTKGKVAAQCCHACLGAYQESQKEPITRGYVDHWDDNGCAKITLKCPDEETMVKMQHKAKELKLVAYCVRDAGRTQIPPNSRTVLAIGPAPVDLINQVSGELQLY
ncbi:peptidyl-tRNA hydrolase [Gorgonomyces haynaldii]|nr:peptidyl-tRNA hydrolase [Gorgonomyces haynaldii]